MTSADLDRRLSALGRPFRLIVTGGGTGGHTYPALTAVRTTAARLAGIGVGLDVLWVGTAAGLEARVAEREGIAFATVQTGKIRRSSNPLGMLTKANIKDMGRVPLGAAQARRIVSDYRPDAVLSTGGYVAVPIGLAAKLCQRPLVIHEQTVRLGLANRALARAATRIAVSSESTLPLLPDATRAHAVVTGNPVRPEVFTGRRERALAGLGLRGFSPLLPTVYITGGAQGSVQINTMIRETLPWLLFNANVIHQCGTTSIEEATAYAARLPEDQRGRYHVTAFVGPELPDVLALADLVIARSGAGTIAELTALGKPSVLIPLASSAGNEQEHNALYLQGAGAATALVKQDATGERLRHAVAPVLASPELRARMAQCARGLGRPDAAERLTDVLLSVAAR